MKEELLEKIKELEDRKDDSYDSYYGKEFRENIDNKIKLLREIYEALNY